MNFRLVKIFFLIISLNSSLVLASQSLATGSYKLELIILDSDEKYPVSISFKSFTKQDLKNYLTDFDINYSSYQCRAKSKNISYSTDSIEIEEKVYQGNEYCEDSKYLIFPTKNNQNKKSFFEKIINVTNGKNIPTIVNTVTFIPSPFTRFLNNHNFSNFDDVKKSNDYQLINKFITTVTSSSPYYTEAFKHLKIIVLASNNITIHEDFLSNNEAKDQSVINSLISLYQEQKTANAYYSAYKLSKDSKDIYEALFLSNTNEVIDSFIEQNPEINNIPNLSSIKLKIFRDESTSNGYLKAFAVSQEKGDIKLAFTNAKNNAEEKRAEESLENFLYPMTEQAEACFLGSIRPSMKTKHPELTSLCDTPERDNMALGLCFAIAGGSCEILTTKIDNPLLQKFPKSLCRKVLSKVVSGTSELGGFDSFHLVDALTYARKQTLSSDNSLIKLFLGVSVAIGEGLTRVAVSDQCKARLRSKCAVLYGVCR